MNEFYARKNDDGTYRIEEPVTVDGMPAKIIIPRAIITIEYLADLKNGDVMQFIVEDDEDE